MAQVHEGLRHQRPQWFTVPAVVIMVGLAGILCISALAWLPSWRPIPSYIVDPAPLWLLAVFAALTAIAEVVYVPVRRADAWEELTFVEVVLTLAVLTLVPIMAMAAAIAGYLFVAVILQRPLIKTAFNLGAYAVAGSGMFITFYVLNRDFELFSLGSMLALLAATAMFSILNMLTMALLLLALEDVPPRQYIKYEWSLSIGMAVGSVGVGVVALSLLQNDPVLVPFAALPAAAMWYAYRSSASHVMAQERSKYLVQLGQAVAMPGGADEVVPPAADALRQVYGADAYNVVLAAGNRYGQDRQWNPPEIMPREVHRLAADELPQGWVAGVAVRLDDRSGRGVLAIGGTEDRGWSGRYLPWVQSWVLPETEEPELVALATAVGSSVRAGQTLSALIAETAKLQAVVDHATDGICVVDADGHVTLWSPAARRITGVVQDDGPTPDIVQRIIAVRPGVQGEEIEFERADGQMVSLLVSRQDVWGSMTSSVYTIRDMTRERRAERLRADFIATISHELRTPITPIRGYADLLKRRWDRMSEEKRTGVLDTIAERADHLTRLVDDLLMASRSEGETSLTVESVRMDLVAVASEAARAFPETDGRLTVAPSEEIWVHADPTRVTQIIGNLVGNALKYTPPGTPIEITFDGTSVSVTDHGQGISEDEQQRVFERFYRIEDPLTMRTGGSGLGLSISRQLARAMGGDVTLRSSPGEGATFTLQLSPEGT